MIHIVVAMSKNRVIGKNNKLPWKIPEDLARFKEITMGHWIVMGRKTFESIGRPLPGRTNIVLTRNFSSIPFTDYSKIIVANSLNAVLSLKNGREIYVIGGENVYRQAIGIADVLHVTVIEKEFDGDAFFPEIDMSKFKLVEKIPGNSSGKDSSGLTWNYLTYKRIEK